MSSSAARQEVVGRHYGQDEGKHRGPEHGGECADADASVAGPAWRALPRLAPCVSGLACNASVGHLIAAAAMPDVLTGLVLPRYSPHSSRLDGRNAHALHFDEQRS